MTIPQNNNSSKGFPTLSLEATAFNRAQLVYPDAPQVALVGRSNVGKSSLVNALAGRKALAKVSATPGKTRSINFYRLGREDEFLVDLPGYGYAKCSQEERRAWAMFMQWYLSNTPGLLCLVLLLDGRLAPQKTDLELVHFARSLSLPVCAVITKADKCSKKTLNACAGAWSAHIPGPLVTVSAKNKTGLAELWNTIFSYVRPDHEGRRIEGTA